MKSKSDPLESCFLDSDSLLAQQQKQRYPRRNDDDIRRKLMYQRDSRPRGLGHAL